MNDTRYSMIANELVHNELAIQALYREPESWAAQDIINARSKGIMYAVKMLTGKPVSVEELKPYDGSRFLVAIGSEFAKVVEA